MTTTEQDDELRIAIHERMIAFRREDGNGYVDRCIEHLDSVMQLITAHTNKQIEEVLDSVEASLDNHTTPEGRDLLTRSYIKNTLDFERNKLKESK